MFTSFFRPQELYYFLLQYPHPTCPNFWRTPGLCVQIVSTSYLCFLSPSLLPPVSWALCFLLSDVSLVRSRENWKESARCFLGTGLGGLTHLFLTQMSLASVGHWIPLASGDNLGFPICIPPILSLITRNTLDFQPCP